MKDKRYEAIVIGVSAGGLQAVTTVLSALTTHFSLPVLITQHQTDDCDLIGFLASYYSQLSPLRVKDAIHGATIEPATVYLSVPGYHLQVEPNKTITLSVSPPVNHAIPSIDVLFETAVEAYRSRLVGVILTGANEDGAIGLQTIKRFGGLTVVQDPASAQAQTMPNAAIAAVDVDHILTLDNIGPFLAGLNPV